MVTFDTKFGPFFRPPIFVTCLWKGGKVFFIFFRFFSALWSLFVNKNGTTCSYLVKPFDYAQDRLRNVSRWGF